MASIIMKNKIILILFVQLIISKFIAAQLPTTAPEYQLVFHDEFDSLYTTIVELDAVILFIKMQI